jgi:enoyl-CoA hydratase
MVESIDINLSIVKVICIYLGEEKQVAEHEALPAYTTGIVTMNLEIPKPGVLLVTLNQPESRNALNSKLLRELGDILNGSAEDNAVRCVVLTGGAEVFAAGSDVKEIAGKTEADIRADPRRMRWQQIRNFSKPLIAAVNGYCLGGGNELAMHCDIIIAGRNAKFGQPEINLGLIPGAGGTQHLTAAVGKTMAMQMILTGKLLDAEEARSYGLVSEVTDTEETIQRAVEIAEQIASKPPLAVQLAKEAILKASDTQLEEGLLFEREAFTKLFVTDDLREGINAFLEKRKPQFTGN